MISCRPLFVTIRSWTIAHPRFYSTRFTYAQSMYQPEFSLESYDCVGFDLDHTICRYRLKPLFHLIYKTLSGFLVDKYNYPASLTRYDDAEMNFAQKGIVLDKKRGNFIKLNNRYEIEKACHGTRVLTVEEVQRFYGPEGIWHEAKGIPQKLVSNTALEEPFYVFKDYFVTAGAVVCAKIVDILDSQNGGPLDEYSFWEHFVDGLFYMYERNNFKNDQGKFFPDLKQNPQQYLEPCSDNVKRWLKSVCENKVSFLLTSSNYDSAAFLAEQCLGKDWKDYFNVIVTFARKPGFFWKDKPFFIVEENTEMGDVKPADMKMHLIYSQGNWKEFQQLCSILSKVKDPKTIYFGDSLVEDVYAASEIAHCDTVAIVEEMLAEGMESVPERHDEAKTLVSNFWGSFFGHETQDENVPNMLSLWSGITAQHSKLAIPNLDFIARLQFQDKVPCFGNDSPVSGYYPGIPKFLVR